MTDPANSSAASWTSGWFFVGLADSLGEDGAHLTFDLPGLSITIQNFRGEIAGFWNVCSHRGARMRACGRGHGLLRCPYHGWTYNRAGVPVGIPENEALFGLDREQKQALALRSIDIAIAGPFLFARVNRAPTGISASLGALASKVESQVLHHAWCVAEHESDRDLPWRSIVDDWVDASTESSLFIPPALIIERDGDWAVLRSCIALAPARTRVFAALYHPDRRPLEAAPPPLRARWLAAVAPHCAMAASEI